MKTPQLLFFLLTLITSIHALAIPTSFEAASHLFKRKGGGGGGGRGGGGFSSSSGGGSRGSSSSGGSRGSSGSRGSTGTGPQPRVYGSGAYYGGGAAQPYKAGRATPGGINPLILPAAGVGFLGAGALAYGYYYYPYHGYWNYHNNSANENQTRPVDCYCAKYQQCACEQRNETDYVNSVANNQSISRVADVNGTETLLVNGTLPNGTDPAAAESKAVALSGGLGQFGGWAVISGAVAWGVWMM